MSGPWDEDPAIETDHPDVKATAYMKEDRVLISVGNFSDDPHEVRLLINWNEIGIDPDRAILTAPAIDDLQEYQQFNVTDPILIRPRKGHLLYLASKSKVR
jgi:hypothetical protein